MALLVIGIARLHTTIDHNIVVDSDGVVKNGAEWVFDGMATRQPTALPLSLA